MTMDDLDLLPDEDVAQDGEKGEHCWHSGFAIDDQERDMVDLETIGEIVDSCPTFVGVGDHDDLVATIDQLAGKLIDVTFDSSWLRKEEVANHSN
jgi:hypothetical protein